MRHVPNLTGAGGLARFQALENELTIDTDRVKKTGTIFIRQLLLTYQGESIQSHICIC